MITKNETGLSQADYDALKAAREARWLEIEAYRYNLILSSVRDTTIGPGVDWDAIQMSSAIVRICANEGTIEYFNGTSWTSYDYTGPTGAANYVALAANGTTLYIFQVGASGIYYATSSDYGDTLSSWTLISNTSGATYISAPAYNELHFVVHDTARNTYQLKVATGGSYTVAASEIYLQHSPTCFSAVTLNSKTYIAISTDTPGTSTARSVGTQVVKYVYRAGGVICFTYQNAAWSDHVDIEVLEKTSSYHYRDRARLSVVNGTVFCSARTSSGSGGYYVTGSRTYTSKDGLYWSAGIIQEGVDNDAYKILRIGDYAYYIARDKVFRSDSTLYLGHAAPGTQITIFDDQVAEYSVQIAEQRQSVLVLSNEGGLFDSTYLADPNNTIALIFKWGFFLDGDSVPTLIQTSVEEVDSIEFSADLPENTLRITSRDRMMWMSDKFQSEQAVYWQSQLVGGDSFLDTTTTGFGGMSHTATHTGAWKTEDGGLMLATKNKEGIAFSTFETDLWNGMFQASFKLSMLSNDEYAGVVFRASDKDNLWYAIYNQTSDCVELYERRAGGSTKHATSSAMSWSGALDLRHIRVVFRYALVDVYTSSDGIAWTRQINHISSGASASGDTYALSSVPLEKGYVGYIAKGYSFEEEWSYEPLPVVLEPIDWGLPLDDFYFDWGSELDYTPDTDMSESPNGGTNKGRFFKLVRDPGDYTNWRVVKVTWPGPAFADISPSLSMRTDTGVPCRMIHDPFDYKRVVILGSSRVCWTDDITATTPVWQTKYIGGNSIAVYTTEVPLEFGGTDPYLTISKGSLYGSFSGESTTLASPLTSTNGVQSELEWVFQPPSPFSMNNLSFRCYKYLTGPTPTNHLSSSQLTIDHDSGQTIYNSSINDTITTNTAWNTWVTKNSAMTHSGIWRVKFFAYIINNNGSWQNFLDDFRFSLSTSVSWTSASYDLIDVQPILGKKNGYFFLFKQNVSGTDYVRFGYTPDFFTSVTLTTVAAWESDKVYTFTYNPHNFQEVAVTAGTGAAAKLYKSTDAGATFLPYTTAVNTRGGILWWNWATETANERNKDPNNLMLIVGLDGSNNLQVKRGGDTAVTIVTGATKYPGGPLAFGANARDMSFMNYVSQDGNLYKSDNAGATWSSVNTIPFAVGGNVRGWWQYPPDKDFLVMFGKDCICFTTNRGTNITDLQSDYETWRASEYGDDIGREVVNVLIDLSRRYPIPVK